MRSSYMPRLSPPCDPDVLSEAGRTPSSISCATRTPTTLRLLCQGQERVAGSGCYFGTVALDVDAQVEKASRKAR